MDSHRLQVCKRKLSTLKHLFTESHTYLLRDPYILHNLARKFCFFRKLYLEKFGDLNHPLKGGLQTFTNFTACVLTTLL